MIRIDCLTASATVESRDSRESQTTGTGAAKIGKPSGRSGPFRGPPAASRSCPGAPRRRTPARPRRGRGNAVNRAARGRREVEAKGEGAGGEGSSPLHARASDPARRHPPHLARPPAPTPRPWRFSHVPRTGPAVRARSRVSPAARRPPTQERFIHGSCHHPFARRALCLGPRSRAHRRGRRRSRAPRRRSPTRAVAGNEAAPPRGRPGPGRHDA